MATPLQRLYRTKLAFLALILTVAGAATLLAAANLADSTRWLWFNSLRPVEIGVALLTGGALAVLLQYVGKRDADEQLRHELRDAIRSEANTIRDSVVNGFAFEPDALANVASPATLDKIAENTLAIQLGGRDMAAAVYGRLRSQAVTSGERCYGSRVSIALTPWDSGPATGLGSMFVATIRWEYRTNATQPTMRFNCVSDAAEYRELLADPTSIMTWQFEQVAGLTADSREVFELLAFSANGQALTPRRTRRAHGAQSYVVSLDQTKQKSKETAISYTFRVLVQRNSHLLRLDIGKPTKGVSVELAYASCGIRHVNLLDYIGTVRKGSNISRLPAQASRPSLSVSYDDWVLPGSGIGFVWVLENELDPGAL